MRASRTAGSIALLLASATLVACTSGSTLQDLGLASTSSVSVDYYPIAGNSIQTLDAQIKRKGPRISRNRHAVAVARISMQPKMEYRKGSTGCSVSSANVAVNARVTLPAWTGRPTAEPVLGAQWDNIDRYTRLHEAVHVAVAFRHARALEARLVALPVEKSCLKARRKALAVARLALKAHDRAQQKFDRDEQRRIASMRTSLHKRDDDFGQPDIPVGLGLPRS